MSLTEEQQSIIATVRRLAQAKFKDRWRHWQDGTFPWDNMRELAEIGVLGMAVPEAYGGTEQSIHDTALALEEIAKVCYVSAMAALGEVGTQTRIIASYAPDTVKDKVLPRVVSGEAMLAICMTEPHAGTDLAAIRTNLQRDGDHWRLRGAKTLISRADVAEGFVVFTRIESIPGLDGVGCAYLDASTPGLEVNSAYHTMGGECLSDVTFDCHVADDQIVLGEGGFKKLINAFNTQRCLNASISLGLAGGALEESVRYVREREAYGQRIGDFQGMRWKLAEMYRDIEAARSILWRACESANPFPDPELAALAKMTCNEMSLRVTSEAVQVHGGYGFVDDYLVSRLYRGARYGSLGGGTTETLKNMIGRSLVEKLDVANGLSTRFSSR